MKNLSGRHGNKNIVIRAHKAELIDGKPVNDSIAYVEKLANESASTLFYYFMMQTSNIFLVI